MNEYEKIINEINSGLTGDTQHDYSYLLEQTEKYKQHPMSHEILKEIGRKIYEVLPSEGKKELSKAIDLDLKSLNKKIDEANNYILQHNYEPAKKILNEYLDAALNAYKEDQITRYFTFKDVIEFYCSKEKLNIQKKLVWIDLRTDDAYKLLAYIASEEKNFSQAIDYLEKGLYFNPMNLGLRFEYAESYKMQHNMEKMYESTKNIYDYIYDPIMLARYYRLLGYYFVEKENYDVAYSLYAISIYYENNEMAHHEINYIKQKTGNPDFEKTTAEILNLLKQQNIPITISESNLNQLKNLSVEKQVIEKQPALIKYLNNVIDIFTTPINDSTEIKGLKITTPKITTEEIFDENKLILDEADKNRIKKNIEILKQKDIPFIEHMKAIPFNSCTSLRSKEEIISRMLADYAIATCALYSLEGKANIVHSVLNQMDEKLNMKSALAPEDTNFLNAIAEQKVSKQGLQDATWAFEECTMLMWALGLIDKPNSDKECNVEQLDKFFFNIKNYDELLSQCTLKSKEEILEQADLLFRYHWACRETRMKGKQLPQLNEMIVQEQRRALEWALNWKIENLMKEKINIKYERDNFNFNFNASTELHISNITNPKDYNLLLTLSDSKEQLVISMSDVGPESGYPLDAYFEEDIRKRKTEGWNIVGTYSLSSQNIKGGFKQLIMNREMPPVKDAKLGLSVYYFVLNGHIVVLKTVLEDTLDYSDNNNIQNSKHNILAMDMLFSIKESESSTITDAAIKMATMMNFGLHARQLDIPLLKNFKIEEVNEPQIVFSATDGMYIEQLVSDGSMKPNETFEQRINLVVKNTTEFMSKYSPANNPANSENKLFYYKDYSNGVFNYKIYVLDGIIEVNNTTKVIRQFNAYFVEPKFNDFYQLTISAPALSMPTEVLKLGVVDLDTDEITQCLNDLLTLAMDNLKYKNEQSSGNNETPNQIEETETIQEEEKDMDYGYINEDEPSVKNNEYDYSTIIATPEAITYLVQYCDSAYKKFVALIDEDEKRNEQFKQEFKNYNYKKTYGERFEVYIRGKNYNTITCKDLASFQSAVNDGNLTNVSSLEIKMNLDFKRGTGNDLTDHENSFTITFKPYEITFTRKSSHNESKMNQIENDIKEILNKFQTVNTIFCTK